MIINLNLNKGVFMNKLMKVSHHFKMLFQSLLVLFPVATILIWSVIDKLPLEMIASNTELGTINIASLSFTPLSKLLGCLISFLATGVIMYGILQFIALFKNYEAGEVFSLQNVRYYRRLGYSLFYFVIAKFISLPLMCMALTFQNPPGKRMVSVLFGSNDFLLLVTGGLVLLISWVMQEAYKIAEENAKTI